jgi:hypothetical protein
MASTYSTNLALELIGTGEQSGTWGTTTNTNLGTLLEQAISGYVTQAITDGASANTTITIPNGTTGVARNMFIEMTGALSVSSTSLIVPANKKMYFIFNNTSGGFAVTVKVSGQTGILVPNGKKVILTCNGTDIVEAHTAIVGNATMGGTLGVTGATTLSSTLGVGDDVYIETGKKLFFRGAGSGQYIYESAVTQLDLFVDGTIKQRWTPTGTSVTGGITATTSIISTTPIYQYKKSASTTIATSSGENIVFAPGASKTMVIQLGNTNGGFLVIVNRSSDGAGAVFYAEYKSATPVKLAGDSDFVVAGSATAAQVAFTKGSNSASFSVITGSGYTGNMTIYVNGTYVTGTVDPA